MAVTGTEVGDFFDDVALLVDLDRKHPTVFTLVVGFGNGGAKGFVEKADAGVEQVFDAQQYRHGVVALFDAPGDFHQRDGHLAGGELHLDRDIAVGVHVKESGTPAADTIEGGGMFHGPVCCRSRIHRGCSPEWFL